MNLNITSKWKLKVSLEPGKYQGKKKNPKENDFLIFGSTIENIKEDKI